MSATVQPLHTAKPDIQGYVDAVEAGRVFGWVWDRSQPDAKLVVDVQLDGKRVATGLADQLREDLAAGKIGDGRHAFEIALPPDCTTEAEARISVLVTSSEGGAQVPLGRRPTPAPTPAPAPAAAGETVAWLKQILRALETLSAGQKAFQKQTEAMLQQAIVSTRPALKSDDEALSSPLEQSIIDLHTAQQTLEKQISGIEVFLLRFDNTLQELAARQVEIPAGRPDRRLYQLLAISGGVALAALALGIFAVVRGHF